MEIQDANGDTAAEHLREVYGKKYSPLLMMDSLKEVDKLLNREAEEPVVLKVIQKNQKLNIQQKERKHSHHER